MTNYTDTYIYIYIYIYKYIIVLPVYSSYYGHNYSHNYTLKLIKYNKVKKHICYLYSQLHLVVSLVATAIGGGILAVSSIQ